MADIKFLKINTKETMFQPTYNDIEFLENGDIAQVYDNDYVAQAVAKVLLTDKNAEVPFPNYGTSLSTLRKSPVGNTVLESLVAQDVVYAIAYIRSLEESLVTTEQITGINNMVAETQNLDAFNKAVSVTLQVVTGNGEVVEVTA